MRAHPMIRPFLLALALSTACGESQSVQAPPTEVAAADQDRVYSSMEAGSDSNHAAAGESAADWMASDASDGTSIALLASPPVWPKFPIPVARTSVPSACGTALHNTACLANPAVETALEKEFWLHVGNLEGKASPAFASLGDWITRTEAYLGYKDAAHRITPQFVYRGTRARYARLTLLLSAANAAMFRSFDIESIVAALASGNLSYLLHNINDGTSIAYFVEALKYADEAYYLDPNLLHTKNFLFPTMAFLQLALPLPFLDLGSLLINTKGTFGLHRRYPLGWDAAFDSFTMVVNTRSPCSGEACGPSLSSTEGAFTYGMSLENIDASRIPWLARHNYINRNNILTLADSIFYEPIKGACETYACQTTSSIAPFKKINGMLISAEIRGKMGRVAEMQTIFAKAKQLATAQGYPFMNRIQEVEDKLLGRGLRAAPGVLSQWANRQGATIGYIQFPLPPSNNPKACSSCHFGGKVKDPGFYYK